MFQCEFCTYTYVKLCFYTVKSLSALIAVIRYDILGGSFCPVLSLSPGFQLDVAFFDGKGETRGCIQYLKKTLWIFLASAFPRSLELAPLDTHGFAH